MTPTRALSALAALRFTYGAEAARTRLGLLRAVDQAVLRTAPAVATLHELLCFIRAYPDNHRVRCYLAAASLRRLPWPVNSHGFAESAVTAALQRAQERDGTHVHEVLVVTGLEEHIARVHQAVASQIVSTP